MTKSKAMELIDYNYRRSHILCMKLYDFMALIILQYEPCHDKTCLCHVQTIKGHISLHFLSLISTYVQLAV